MPNRSEELQSRYATPLPLLKLLKNLRECGFDSDFSFEQGILKITIKKQDTK